MPKTKKVKVTLEPRDVVVVMPIEFWEHLIDTYTDLAEQAEENDKESWYQTIDFVRVAIEDTFFDPNEEEEAW